VLGVAALAHRRQEGAKVKWDCRGPEWNTVSVTAHYTHHITEAKQWRGKVVAEIFQELAGWKLAGLLNP
jgi:hypothetical protein